MHDRLSVFHRLRNSREPLLVGQSTTSINLCIETCAKPHTGSHSTLDDSGASTDQYHEPFDYLVHCALHAVRVSGDTPRSYGAHITL